MIPVALKMCKPLSKLDVQCVYKNKKKVGKCTKYTEPTIVILNQAGRIALMLLSAASCNSARFGLVDPPEISNFIRNSLVLRLHHTLDSSFCTFTTDTYNKGLENSYILRTFDACMRTSNFHTRGLSSHLVQTQKVLMQEKQYKLDDWIRNSLFLQDCILSQIITYLYFSACKFLVHE